MFGVGRMAAQKVPWRHIHGCRVAVLVFAVICSRIQASHRDWDSCMDDGDFHLWTCASREVNAETADKPSTGFLKEQLEWNGLGKALRVVSVGMNWQSCCLIHVWRMYNETKASRCFLFQQNSIPKRQPACPCPKVKDLICRHSQRLTVFSKGRTIRLET